MGFHSLMLPCHSQHTKMKGLDILSNLLYSFKSITIALLAHLGLQHLSEQTILSAEEEEEEEEEEENRPNYLLVIDGVSPFVVPVPLHVLTAHIKRELPIVELGQLRKGGDHKECFCSICLECFEKSHEVRELFNCDHVFHRDCLDSWVDQGQVTCPLCRSMLFKKGREILQEIYGRHERIVSENLASNS
ncbi:hypothetical protein TIFTF001_003148 [Ficus carica]|uniref:RING-type domain-containing protein n=1 Tax=Ficus carica TaxID=3494 RepID=A0AA87ZY56_FICCA|nr:hypothetical protein TIFTF001_003148 [Ficus carica]